MQAVVGNELGDEPRHHDRLRGGGQVPRQHVWLPAAVGELFVDSGLPAPTPRAWVLRTQLRASFGSFGRGVTEPEAAHRAAELTRHAKR